MQAPTTAAASRAAPRRAVVCAAARTSQVDVSKAVAAAALAAVIGFGQVDAAKADISGLTPCSESKAYQKRLKNELKALNKRLKNVRACRQASEHASGINGQFMRSCGTVSSLGGIHKQ
jgi:photosystem I subunit 3